MCRIASFLHAGLMITHIDPEKILEKLTRFLVIISPILSVALQSAGG